MADFTEMKNALVELNGPHLLELVNAALAEGVAAETILNEGLIAGMDIVGEKMENEDLFIPEVLMAAQMMSQAVETLKPLLGEESSAAGGRVVIGTVKGDLHDIGKNLVAMMLESSGLTVHNIGVDIAPEEFINQIRQHNADILCLSALLTTTMPMMKKTIEAVRGAGLRDQVKIMVGGAPVTQAYAEEIGADRYAPDAGSAARAAKALVAAGRNA